MRKVMQKVHVTIKLGASLLTFHVRLHLNNVVTIEPRLSVPAKGLPTLSEIMNLQRLGVGIRCWVMNQKRKPGKSTRCVTNKKNCLVPSDYFGVWGVVTAE